jgi:hypothetical protein
VFHSRQGQNFLFATSSRADLSPTQPPVQWVLGALSQGIKRLGLESDHSPSSSAKLKKGGAITSLLPTSLWRGAYLIKHRGFTVPRYYGGFGLSPLSGVLKNNVSETGSCHPQMRGGRDLLYWNRQEGLPSTTVQ